MHFSWLGKYRDVGIFLLRVGIGAMMVMHGWPKLAEGQHAWEKVGMAMQHLGVYSYPAIWGFLAAMSETVGGALLVVGFLVRPAALSIAITRECDGCIAAHARGASRRGATRAQVAEMIGVAIAMNGGPATVYGPRALEAFDQFSAAAPAD